MTLLTVLHNIDRFGFWNSTKNSPHQYIKCLNWALFLVIFITLVVIFMLMFFCICWMCYKTSKTNKINQATCPNNQICLSRQEYANIISKKQDSINITRDVTNNDMTDLRDRLVLNDPLYPPLNRTNSNTFEATRVIPRVRNQSSMDTFHLVGYLTSSDEITKDNGGNSWKLMARQKDRNESEFYIIPTNNNYSIKIPITQDIVIGERLRDIYSIPKELRFNSPLLNRTPYEFIEIPKTDFSSETYN